MLEQRRSGAVVCSSSGRPEAWAAEASSADPVKPGVERRSYAPIMVSCSGSDEGDSSSSDQQQQSTPLLQPNTSVTSMLDGMDSANYRSIMSSQPTPARMISEAEVQAGCFKTGVRYCLETWPNSCILRVRVRSSWAAAAAAAWQCAFMNAT